MVLLENENLKVALSAKGAELNSIYSKETGLEYLWNADPAYWAKHSPVLFPVVGALKADTYYTGGQSYRLSRHGFARDQVFRVQQISDTEVLFELQSSPDTLKVYPFEFTLGLRYKLSANTVSCTYGVMTPGDREILFSIGGHPAFAAPQTADTVYEDYYLYFEEDRALTWHKIKDNLISEETVTRQLDHDRLPLRHELFYEDALVIKNMHSKMVSLRNSKNAHGLNFRFEGFPYFGIWAAKDAGFICLEPWCGIADSTGHNQQLSDKEGIVSLSPGQQWERTWSAEIF